MPVIQTELYSSGSWTGGPYLPENMFSACAARVTDDVTFIAGDHNGGAAYLYHWDSDHWTRLDNGGLPFIFDRGSTCGALKDGNDDVVAIVVAGGNDAGRRTAILEMNVSQQPAWREWNLLPDPLSHAVAVPYHRGFLLVGGDSGNDDMMYASVLEVTINGVRTRDGALQAPRSGMAAVMLDGDDYPCCRPGLV